MFANAVSGEVLTHVVPEVATITAATAFGRGVPNLPQIEDQAIDSEAARVAEAEGKGCCSTYFKALEPILESAKVIRVVLGMGGIGTLGGGGVAFASGFVGDYWTTGVSIFVTVVSFSAFSYAHLVSTRYLSRQQEEARQAALRGRIMELKGLGNTLHGEATRMQEMLTNQEAALQEQKQTFDRENGQLKERIGELETFGAEFKVSMGDLFTSNKAYKELNEQNQRLIREIGELRDQLKALEAKSATTVAADAALEEREEALFVRRVDATKQIETVASRMLDAERMAREINAMQQALQSKDQEILALRRENQGLRQQMQGRGNAPLTPAWTTFTPSNAPPEQARV